jgi:hypothetical protein
MTQEAAVYNAIVDNCVCDDNGVFNPSKEERALVTEILCAGFKAGTIALKDTPSNQAKLDDDAKLRSYCSGLQSNWLRKDKRLNGGIKYEPKNPGSRTGSTDPQVKAMRNLLAIRTDLSAEDKKEIQAKIDERVAKVKPVQAELTAEQIKVLNAAGLGHLVPKTAQANVELTPQEILDQEEREFQQMLEENEHESSGEQDEVEQTDQA